MEKLTKEQMKLIVGGDETLGDDAGVECKSTCTTTSDCPTDRYCGNGTCGGIEIKSCFKYP